VSAHQRTVRTPTATGVGNAIAAERPDAPDAVALIEELEAHLSPQYPSESRHGYSVDKLVREGVAFFVARVGGKPAGCGGIQLYPDYGELKRMYVRPAFRGLGLGKKLIDVLAEFALSKGVNCLRLETGIHQTEAIGLYQARGFVEIGPFGEYREDPNSRFFEKRLPDRPETAPVFRIREATAADVSALAKLHVQTFNETHRGGRSGGPTYELREQQWRETFEKPPDTWFCFIAEGPSAELVGFAKGTLHDGGVPGFTGELNKIYVLRSHHRRGIGKALLLSVASRFVDRGVTSMLLFGEASNPSNGFYEAFGAERLYGAGGEFHGAYGWRDLTVLLARAGS
jgi:putative acetyltransferase